MFIQAIRWTTRSPLFDDDLSVIPVDAVAACAAAFAEVRAEAEAEEERDLQIALGEPSHRSQVLNASLGPKGFIVR